MVAKGDVFEPDDGSGDMIKVTRTSATWADVRVTQPHGVSWTKRMELPLPSSWRKVDPMERLERSLKATSLWPERNVEDCPRCRGEFVAIHTETVLDEVIADGVVERDSKAEERHCTVVCINGHRFPLIAMTQVVTRATADSFERTPATYILRGPLPPRRFSWEARRVGG